MGCNCSVAREPNLAIHGDSFQKQIRSDGAGAVSHTAPGGASEATPAKFNVHMQVKPGDRLGIVLGNAGSGAVVASIDVGGWWDQWNKSNPQRAVRPGFIIEGVNGTRGIWKIVEEMSRPGAHLVRISSRAPGGAVLSSLPSVRAKTCGAVQCPICMEDVAPDQMLAQLPCKHAFHTLCVARWLSQTKLSESGQTRSCPLCCRKVVCCPEGGMTCSEC